jgi:hypothetical protein
VDSAQAAEIEAIFSEGGRPGVGGRIAVGSVDYNKDYYSPDHRFWNWHYIEEDQATRQHLHTHPLPDHPPH